jgi:hypothetical protein
MRLAVQCGNRRRGRSERVPSGGAIKFTFWWPDVGRRTVTSGGSSMTDAADGEPPWLGFHNPFTSVSLEVLITPPPSRM